MNTPPVHSNKLLQLFPTGLVLGEANAIVGQFGLEINWINRDLTKSAVYLKPDEQLPIIQIRGDMLEVGSWTPSAWVHYKRFKGFVIKKMSDAKH
jgi:hypothetical protein